MQVISNLIANAIYAMPNGGQLSVLTEDVDVPVSGMVFWAKGKAKGVIGVRAP